MLLLLFASTSFFLIIDDGDEMGVLAAARVLDVFGDEARRLEPPAGGFNIIVSYKRARGKNAKGKKYVLCVRSKYALCFITRGFVFSFRGGKRKKDLKKRFHAMDGSQKPQGSLSSSALQRFYFGVRMRFRNLVSKNNNKIKNHTSVIKICERERIFAVSF